MSDFKVICSMGEPALLEQLAEECSELAHAALKLARLERGENPTPKTEEECVENLLEELGDVNLCMSVVEANRGIHIRCLFVDKKARWAQRIREARGETPKKKKTRQSEFLKIFPKVGLKEGVIDICPLFLDKTANCIKVNCRVCQKDFWLAEVK
uniref:Pyrophosphatase n=1 Tax=Siphoviridae sp. ctmxA102 TaxID=2825657 RepID=A0A8S5TVZ7_9CAUD|nr:MAG TPA: pyrophosphatase [Siphoviridae sp. ctmxA102]